MNNFMQPGQMSPNVNNLASMARMALEEENIQKARDLCDRILEVDYTNIDAWVIKIKCYSNKHSTPKEHDTDLSNQLRMFQESCSVISNIDSRKKLIRAIMESEPWKNLSGTSAKELEYGYPPSEMAPKVVSAFYNVDEELAFECLKSVVNRSVDAFSAFSRSICNRFANNYREEFAVNSTASYLRSVNATLLKTIETSLPAFRQLFLLAVDHMHNITTEIKSLYSVWESYLSKTDKFTVKVGAYMEWSTESALSDSESRKVQALLTEISAAQRETAEYQRKFAEIYWHQHPEQKAALDREIENTRTAMFNLESAFKKLDYNSRVQSMDHRITDLKDDYRSLGIFKRNQKKDLKTQIEDLEAQQASLVLEKKESEEKLAKEKAQFQAKLNQLQKKLLNPEGTY